MCRAFMESVGMEARWSTSPCVRINSEIRERWISCTCSSKPDRLKLFDRDELHRARSPADPEGDDEFSTYKAVGLLKTQVRNGEL
ncbi:hypothetical protein MHYP_G00132580 [Metynnis hypsauchen]